MAEPIEEKRGVKINVRKGSESERSEDFLKPSLSSEKAKRQKAPPPEEDWEKEYSLEEKMLKARLEGQGYGEWEKKNRSWELQKGLVPTADAEEEGMRRRKGLSRFWINKPSKEREKAPPEDWEKEYSYEEKMLRSRLDRQGYDKWEKKHRLWEIQNCLVPVAEDDEEEYMRLITIRFLLVRLSEQDTKEAKEPFEKRIEQLLKKESNWETKDLACRTVQLPPEEEKRIKRLPTPEALQYFYEKGQARTRVTSWVDERENLAAQGRCLDGSYLTPYCKCTRDFYRFDTTLEDGPPECLPIWLAYCRQFRRSHCFDIDDFVGGRVCPLELIGGWNVKAEMLLELANLAIQDYNEKECNVFKYKVLKIEKVNCSPATHAYWMTVQALNLTLGTPIETFQIHAGRDYGKIEKVIFCCRPKEEAIIGLPSCEFCFGLLPGHVTGGQEP